MRTLQILSFVCLAPLLGGCLTTGPGSVMGGECKVFERPEYVVLGKRSYDQNWIDGNVEAGVGGCGWQRPKPRPASVDGGAAISAPVKKRGFLGRAKARVKSIIRRAPAPVPQPPAAPVRTFEAIVAPPAIVPPPPPKPSRSDVDELLDPRR